MNEGVPSDVTAVSGRKRASCWLVRPTLSKRRAVRLGCILVLCLAVLSWGCSLKPKVGAETSASGSAICKTALSTVGTPYRMGGATPGKGFDCSGLVLWAYARHGVNLPRTAREQSRIGRAVAKGALQQGDIVVFRVPGGMHTGIYTGSGKFVHSPSRGKTVREDRINATYWKKRFVSGRRVS